MNYHDNPNILIDDYLRWRAYGEDPQMIAFKEGIMDMLTQLRKVCELEDITDAELDAAWEARKRHDTRS